MIAQSTVVDQRVPLCWLLEGDVRMATKNTKRHKRDSRKRWLGSIGRFRYGALWRATSRGGALQRLMFSAFPFRVFSCFLWQLLGLVVTATPLILRRLVDVASEFTAGALDLIASSDRTVNVTDGAGN